MTKTLLKNKWLFALCLIAALSLGACSDDSDTSGTTPSNNQNNADASDFDTDETDVEEGDVEESDVEESDVDESDTEESDPDGSDELSCDVNGFELPDGEVLIEEMAGGWTVFVNAQNRAFSLYLSNEDVAGGVGSVEFEDVPFDEQTTVLMLADQCNPLGCEALYLATAGTLDISVFDQEQPGRFEGVLSGLELVQISTEESDNFARIEDGKLWCIDTLELNATTDPRDTFPDTVSCDHNDFPAPGSGTGETLARPADGGSTLLVDTSSQSALPHDILSLQIYGDLDGAASSAGTYQLDDFNYATCVNCLLVYTDCTTDSCAKTFIAGRGELDISASGQVDGEFRNDETFAATLRNAELVEVTIDPNTYEARLVEGGESWCISEFTWSDTIRSAPQ